ncbi:protein ANTAGONIST OF LIKE HETEROCHROMATIN PROTEIN 1-like [Sceloporus undulatus]|uniref:protein ANTAGONIST OF LIKE HETEROCHROMATIN PROTEIN 1-like n=1 Tax=Sceloporus undulatus TaxID=8520 RepID=UPI001C4ACACB|nr:protein ANTAGONIST OF LIKE HETEROCHROMATIN PROTEIN 1-like [Sceloporus undulatus]
MPGTPAMEALRLMLSVLCQLISRYQQLQDRRRARRRIWFRFLTTWMRARGVGDFTTRQVFRLLMQGDADRVLAFVATMPAPRRYWIRPKMKGSWWNEELLHMWDDEMWMQHFRMPRGTIFRLADILRPHIAAMDTVMRRAITVEERVAITIWWLSGPLTYQNVAHQFQIGSSTASVICIQVCEAIVKVLLRKVVRLENHHRIMEGFEQLGFPNCVGAVDGTHILIRPPRGKAEEYYNRKYGFSIVMQGTTDHTGRFINIEAGFSGRHHDAYIFRQTGIFKAMEVQMFVPGNPSITVLGVQVPPLLVGDGAYPIRKWLMKPYRGGNITPAQNKFNAALSRARCVVERAFGRLKNRWGCLLGRLTVGEPNFATVVSACAVLHNICETRGACLNDIDAVRDIGVVALPELLNVDQGRCRREGKDVRTALTRWFQQQR